jgi:hypothetical protein
LVAEPEIREGFSAASIIFAVDFRAFTLKVHFKIPLNPPFEKGDLKSPSANLSPLF